MDERCDPTELIDALIDREGGYVHHPADRGGATCYGVTEAELGTQRPSPPPTTTLQKREIEAVADYLLAKVINRGPVTREECEERFGQGARSCGQYPNKP